MPTLTSLRRVWAEGDGELTRPSRTREVEAPLTPSEAGFLLLDSSLVPMYVNSDAAQVLCYPQTPKASQAAIMALKKRLHSLLQDRLPDLGRPSLVEFSSEKRRYLLKAFCLDSFMKGRWQPAYALFIERGHHPMLDLAHIRNEYGLTNREIQTLRFLLGGLTSKEIASRMNISANTVKAFLRQIMLKMGVTTRAGIIGKFVSS